MKVVVNIKKVHFYAIAGLLVLFGGMFAVNAFGGVAPSVMGHSVGEIDFSGGFNVPSGNVGVGVASPTQKLDVNGNARISGNVLASTYCDINGANCVAAATLSKVASSEIGVYVCPIGAANGWHPGGYWGYYGCQGQITTQATCITIEWPSQQLRNCKYIGKMRVYP